MTSLTKTIAFIQRRVPTNFLRAYSSTGGVPKYETLDVSVPIKHVYHVELNRPAKLNTFIHTSWLELKECFSTLSDNPECRVVLISAKGKHFTAGIDIKDFMTVGAKAAEYDDVARKARFMHKHIGIYQDGITALEKCVKPVIALTHNGCIGAGVDLITAADMRYCTSDGWFQVKEVDVGLAADVGTLQRLPKVIGSSSIARELCYTARRVDSQEALQIGLVSKVFPDKEIALKSLLEVAGTIASKSPVAVQTTKQNLVFSLNKTNDEGLEHIRILNQTMLQSEDLTKAAIAGLAKESAEYENY